MPRRLRSRRRQSPSCGSRAAPDGPAPTRAIRGQPPWSPLPRGSTVRLAHEGLAHPGLWAPQTSRSECPHRVPLCHRLDYLPGTSRYCSCLRNYEADSKTTPRKPRSESAHPTEKSNKSVSTSASDWLPSCSSDPSNFKHLTGAPTETSNFEKSNHTGYGLVLAWK